MSTPAPFAIDSDGPESTADSVLSGNLAVRARRALQYKFLLLLTLGIAVVVWGSWWKFSEYSPHPDPTYKVLTAKLWVGPLPDLGVRSAQLSAGSRLRYVLHSLHESISARPRLVFVARVFGRQDAPEVDRSIPAITSRPPPSEISFHS